MPANIIWGAVALATLTLLFISPLLALTVFLLVLPLPTAVLFRLGAKITRGEPTSISDVLAWRIVWRRALVAGVAIGGALVVLGFNLIVGASSLDVPGVALGTAAFWGLVVVWFVAAALWPLLFDPVRDDEPIAELVRLAVAVIATKLLRYLVLMVVLAVFLVVSTVLAAALLTVSAAYFALVMSLYSLHAADRIEQRATIVVTK